MALVEVRDLTKTYRVRRRDKGRGAWLRRMVTPAVDVHTAVAGVDFNIDGGEIVGYLGANGAGKSTTVKCLSGILTPDSGHVRVAGLDPRTDRVALTRRIGVMFGQKTTLWWDLPLHNTYQLLRDIYDIPADQFASTLSSLSEILALDEFLHVPVRQLSLGQRVRADLAAAFLHRPDVIVLDEPTIGLDALAKANVRRFIRDVRDTHGVAVLLTTHDLGDIEQLCDRLLIIDRGKLLFDGSVADAIRAFAPQTSLVVDLTEEVPDPLVPPAGADDIVREGPTRLRIHFARTADTAARVTSEVLTRYQVRDLLLEEPRIEDVVRRLYAEKGHPAADQIEAADV